MRKMSPAAVRLPTVQASHGPLRSQPYGDPSEALKSRRLRVPGGVSLGQVHSSLWDECLGGGGLTCPNYRAAGVARIGPFQS